MTAPIDDRMTTTTAAGRRTTAALLWSIVLTIALYLVPFGELLGYPLVLLSTLVHEVGHGIAAVLVGGRFERFVMFSDASGMAYSTGVDAGWPRAIVAAGGLIGPALGAGVAFIAARRPLGSRVLLVVASLALVALLVLVVRNPFGIAFAGLLLALLGWLGLRASASTAQVGTVFMAVQLALSVFSRGDYLFVKEAHTGAGVTPSDVSVMASALGGPYWVWGLACGAFSIAVLVGGIWAFLRALPGGRIEAKRAPAVR